MKIKNKTWKTITIIIERVVEQRTEKGMTENNTLFYLINARTPEGRGVGFRANSPLDAWSKMMQEIHF
jgi:hypothetical protein